MKHGSLFNGVGGFQLAAEWMGWENSFSCEIDEFCNKVTKYYWPNCKQYGDIRKTDFTIWRGLIDILTGGFPCQPFSNSGEGLGEADERYLFEEMLRAAREIKPGFILAENVSAITSRKFEDVFEYICSSLENEGYKVQPIIIPATSVEADHERYRVWIAAYSNGFRFSGQGNVLGQVQPTKIGNRETSRFVDFFQKNSMPFMCDSHYGLSRGLAHQAIHAGGNAIVPHIAYELFRAFEQCNFPLKNY